MLKEVQILIEEGEYKSKNKTVFKNLIQMILEKDRYKITQNVHDTGLEINLFAEHKTKNEILYAECKAKIKPKSTEINNFIYAMDYGWASALISIGAIAGLTSVLLVLQMAGTRIFYSISRDGLLPAALSKIHPKLQTPHICTILVGIFVGLGAGLLPINLLAEMCNIGTLGAFLVVCLGVAILRFTDPERKRPFKAPGGLLIPALGMAGCLFVMKGLPATTWVVTIGWFLLGMVIYFSYGIWNSKLNDLEDNV